MVRVMNGVRLQCVLDDKGKGAVVWSSVNGRFYFFVGTIVEGALALRVCACESLCVGKKRKNWGGQATSTHALRPWEGR